MTHAMLDLETLGRRTNAAICSIGALIFDPKGARVMSPTSSQAFHCLIDLENSPQLGVCEPDTVRWWMMQSEEARAALFGRKFEEYTPLRTALSLFAQWCFNHHVENVWSNSPTFDERILFEAYDRCGMKHPFSYRGSRDFRTLAQLVEDRGCDPRAIIKSRRQDPAARKTTLHNAIDDCYNQSWAVCRFYQILGLAPEQPILDSTL